MEEVIECLTDEELEKLANCKNRQEWKDICQKIKQTHDGHYPSDWYSKVIASRLLAMKYISFLDIPGNI